MLKFPEIQNIATDKTIRQFGGLFLLFTLFVSWIQWQKGVATEWPIGFIFLGILSFLIGITKPAYLRPIFVGWMVLLFPVNWLVSHVILGILFFLLFTPIGLCRRLLGGDPLLLKKPNCNSYWQARPQINDKRRYLRQY
jgi:hypothetical protein